MNNKKIHKYYTVYKITNLLNNMEYIGFHSTDNLDDNYMGSGVLIRRAIAKYGIENFKKEILKVFNNQQDAEALERELVNPEYIAKNNTYNISLGGNVTFIPGYKIEVSKQNCKNIDKQISILQERIANKAIEKNTKIYNDTECIKINGIIYSCVLEAMTLLNIKLDNDIKELMIQTGNGYINANKQYLFEKEYLSELLFRKKRAEDHLEALRKSTKDPIRNAKISKKLKGRKNTWMIEANKNPQKIAKTAAKHRGMKRSKKTCKNISNAKKTFYKNNDVYNKNLIFIHNKITGEKKYISKTEQIPNGWELGLGPTKAAGKKWYMDPNDWTQTKNFSNDEVIPDGWIPGNGNLRLAKMNKNKVA